MVIVAILGKKDEREKVIKGYTEAGYKRLNTYTTKDYGRCDIIIDENKANELVSQHKIESVTDENDFFVDMLYGSEEYILGIEDNYQLERLRNKYKDQLEVIIVKGEKVYENLR